MKIEALISGKGNADEAVYEGIAMPVRFLKKALDEGYSFFLPYPREKTVVFWGKQRTACWPLVRMKDTGRQRS